MAFSVVDLERGEQENDGGRRRWYRFHVSPLPLLDNSFIDGILIPHYILQNYSLVVTSEIRF